MEEEVCCFLGVYILIGLLKFIFVLEADGRVVYFIFYKFIEERGYFYIFLWGYSIEGIL